MGAFLASLGMVVLAEMGDKTQLLAMAFAAKYRPSQVLWGVFLGALLNHGLAVMIGVYLGNVLPLNAMGVAAGALFLLFALWNLRPENDEDEETEKPRFGAVATVALSFFLGEMGDKTQLTALTMAVEYRLPLQVLVGAVSGMLIVNGPGIFLGDFLLRRIPPRLIKLVSSAVFVLFGEGEFYEHLAHGIPTLLIMGASAAVTVGIGWYLLHIPELRAAQAARTDHVA